MRGKERRAVLERSLARLSVFFFQPHSSPSNHICCISRSRALEYHSNHRPRPAPSHLLRLRNPLLVVQGLRCTQGRDGIVLLQLLQPAPHACNTHARPQAHPTTPLELLRSLYNDRNNRNGRTAMRRCGGALNASDAYLQAISRTQGHKTYNASAEGHKIPQGSFHRSCNMLSNGD